MATGSGAIYWHVAGKDELLAAATDAVVAGAVTGARGDADPREAVRAIALGAFDAIDAHPWVGTQLSREPWQPAVLHLMEGFGQQLQALGAPEEQQFDAATALVSYVLGPPGTRWSTSGCWPARWSPAASPTRPPRGSRSPGWSTW